jgi:hypothetical protein
MKAFSVSIRAGGDEFDYNVVAGDQWDARQVALRQHHNLGRGPGWVVRCSL